MFKCNTKIAHLTGNILNRSKTKELSKNNDYQGNCTLSKLESSIFSVKMASWWNVVRLVENPYLKVCVLSL